MHAKGTFEVTLRPLEPYNTAAGTNLGRMSIDKVFHGDLEGVSKGEMLTGGSPASGSAGYVAMEFVAGTVGGKRGAFIFQHSATMTKTSQHLSLTVVPGSGTGELAGLEGAMTITIVEGKHFYDFEYAIGAPAETRKS